MKPSEEQLITWEATTPPTADVQTMIREYIASAGIGSMAAFAKLAHVSEGSVIRFLKGDYHLVAKTDVMFRRKMVDFMTRHPLHVADAEKLHETSNVRVARQWFNLALDKRGMAFVYGPPGSQKTFIFRHLVAETNRTQLAKNGHGRRAYYVYCSQNIAPADIIRKMAAAAGVPANQSAQKTLANLRAGLAIRQALFVLDEAQHLSIPALELVREVNDCEPHSGILLAGSHQLYKIFQQRAAELEQWNSRMMGGVALPGIEESEAYNIIQSELGALPAKKLQYFVDQARVPDSFAHNKQYISARRLFLSVARVKEMQKAGK